jgi:hypothetical protein
MLKKEAHLKNQTNIDLKETDFANKIQKSLYRQWDRIFIIYCTDHIKPRLQITTL